MTAFGDPATHEAAGRLGAMHMLAKPFDMDRVLALIHKICVTDYSERDRAAAR